MTGGPQPRPLPFRTGVGLLCLYAVLAGWWLRPVTSELRDHVPGLAGSGALERLTFADVYLTLWVLTAGVQQLSTHPTELFHPPAFYPERYALGLSEHMLGHQLLFAPTYGVSANPVLALNVSLLLSTALLGFGTHLLVRRWGAGLAAAVLGAVLAVCAPWRVGAEAARVHTLWVHYLPFLLLFLDRYLVERRGRDLALAAACLVLQTWTSYYTGYAAVVLVAVYLLAHVRSTPGGVARAGAGMLGALAVAAAASYPYLVLARAGAIQAYRYDVLPLFFSLQGMPGVLTRQQVGIVPVALTLLGLVSRRWRATSDRAPYPALLGIAAAGYILALGPSVALPRAPGEAVTAVGRLLVMGDQAALERALTSAGPDLRHVPTPYALLAAVVPGFTQLRNPFRFGVLPATVLPVTAALAVGGLTALPAMGRAVLALAIAAAVVLRTPPVVATPVEAGEKIPRTYQWLRENGAGRPLLEAPVRTGLAAVLGGYEECRAMYLATYHRLPLVNGYSGFVPESVRRRYEVAARLPHPSAIARLCAETRLGWILLHRDRLAAEARAAWDDPPAALAVAATFGDDVVFSVRCPGGSP